MNLKVLSWNCQSIRNKVSRITDHLKTHFYHVILFQETWLNDTVSIDFPNYNLVRADRKVNTRNPHGGVAILVHSSIHFESVEFCSMDFVESIFIRVFYKSDNILIGNIYSPSSLSNAMSKCDFEKLLAKPGPFLLAGDFNAKHKLWNNSKNCRKGVALEKLCKENSCSVHNPEFFTLIPSVGNPSIIDFVITKGNTSITKPKIFDTFSSDHLPVTFEIFSCFNNPNSLQIQSFFLPYPRTFDSLLSKEIGDFKRSTDCSSQSSNNVETFNKNVNESFKKNSSQLFDLFKDSHTFNQQNVTDNLDYNMTFKRKTSFKIPSQRTFETSINREVKKITNNSKAADMNAKWKKWPNMNANWPF